MAWRPPRSRFWLGTPASTHPRQSLYADRTFKFQLAEHLHKSIAEIDALPASEVRDWMAYFVFKAKRAKEK